MVAGCRLLPVGGVRDCSRRGCCGCGRPTTRLQLTWDYNLPAFLRMGRLGFLDPHSRNRGREWMAGVRSAKAAKSHESVVRHPHRDLVLGRWHLPRFFYYAAYMELGFSVLPLVARGFLALAIVLTWLYNSTRGSILMAALFHGGYNFWAASGGAGGSITSTIDALFIIWAVALVVVCGPANLSPKREAHAMKVSCWPV